jgi:hypothetical protein
MLGVGREAIVLITRYVMQQGAKAGHTVGLSTDAKTNLYLSHGRLSIGAEYIGLGARMYKNHCAPVLMMSVMYYRLGGK